MGFLFVMHEADVDDRAVRQGFPVETPAPATSVTVAEATAGPDSTRRIGM